MIANPDELIEPTGETMQADIPVEARAIAGPMSTRQLFPMLAVGVMGNSVIYLIPLLVGAMVADRGFTEAQAGFMASADLAGYAVATVVAALLLSRVRWRRLAVAGVVLLASANLATMAVSRVELFAGVRFISGLGAGILAAIATVALGQTQKPDRSYGLFFAGSLLFATVCLWGMPLELAAFGLNGAYFLIAVLALFTGLVARYLPENRADGAAVMARGTRRSWLLACMVLASILIFFAEQNALWAYIERIGNSAGFTGEYIGFSLGVATLTGFAGAALVAWGGDRVGRLIPILTFTVLQLGCFVLLFGRMPAIAYLIAVAVLALSWNVINPYQLAILAEVDPSGRALALAATVTGAGLALGPAIGAVAMTRGGYGKILLLAAILAIISMLLLLMPQKAAARERMMRVRN